MGLDTHMGLGLPVPGTSSSKRNLNRPQPRDVSRAALAEAVDGGASGFFPPGHPPHPPRSLTAAVSSWNPLASDNRFILEMKIGRPEPRRVWWQSQELQLLPLQGLIHSVRLHLFIQQTFIECLLHARC